MKIPITIPYLGEEEAEAAKEVVLSGWVTQGPKVEQFERDFAKYCHAKYAVAVSNGTTALHLSLYDSGVQAGDEVICPSMSFIATANAIKHCGAEPVFAEVNADFNLDIEDVKRKITKNTKAIVLVHQIGTPADIDAFKKLCLEENLVLVEDAACGVGAEYKGRKIGSEAEYACFSLHPRKIITTGEGGMILTNSIEIRDRLKLLRQHGMSVNDRVRHNSSSVVIESYDVVGFNFRMTDVQAAIGIEQVKKLDFIIQRRHLIAKAYVEGFKDLKKLSLPILAEESLPSFQSYAISLTNQSNVSRDDLMQQLLDLGIATRRGIMLAHREKPYLEKKSNLPMSDDFANNSLLIPMYPQMTNNQVEYVISSVKSILIDV